MRDSAVPALGAPPASHRIAWEQLARCTLVAAGCVVRGADTSGVSRVAALLIAPWREFTGETGPFVGTAGLSPTRSVGRTVCAVAASPLLQGREAAAADGKSSQSVNNPRQRHAEGGLGLAPGSHPQARGVDVPGQPPPRSLVQLCSL